MPRGAANASGALMRIGITANPRKVGALAIAERAARVLAPRAELVVAESIPPGASFPQGREPIEQMRVDVIVAIGGDGTFLSVLQRTPVPLLAINAGTVGVLAEVDGRDLDAIDAALDRLVHGFYFVEDRMKLAVQTGDGVAPDASNEVVVHCARAAKMGHFEIALDGRPFGRIRADGIILATPTGSTAYALSALGPIVEPSVEGIVAVAIAPFRAVARAIVIDPLRTVTIRPLPTGASAVAVIDGHFERPIPADGSVVVYRSPRQGRFVRFGAPHFLRLRGKGILPWSESLGVLEENEEEHGRDVPPPA